MKYQKTKKKNENNSGGISSMILPMLIMWIFKKTRQKSLFHMCLLNCKLRIEQIGKWKKKHKILVCLIEACKLCKEYILKLGNFPSSKK